MFKLQQTPDYDDRATDLVSNNPRFSSKDPQAEVIVITESILCFRELLSLLGSKEHESGSPNIIDDHFLIRQFKRFILDELIRRPAKFIFK